jgi:hypothetical protein
MQTCIQNSIRKEASTTAIPHLWFVKANTVKYECSHTYTRYFIRKEASTPAIPHL